MKHRPDVPLVYTDTTRPKAAGRVLATGLRHVDRPWAIGVDALLCVLLAGLMAWEGLYEFPHDMEWQHMAAALAALIALALHGMRAFTTERED